MSELISNFLFIWQRFTWESLIDILLVAAFFAVFLYLLRDTEGQTLLRGAPGCCHRYYPAYFNGQFARVLVAGIHADAGLNIIYTGYFRA